MFLTTDNSKNPDYVSKYNKISHCVIYVDINGTKPPNRWGYDFFEFSVFNDEILPAYSPIYISEQEMRTMCLNSGYSCGARILTYYNILYRRCPDDLRLGVTNCF